jgi:APA family basic amino acid/polyamine antiporter
MMPQVGGQYVFLREAYNPLCGFLFGWTQFLVIQCGSIAAVAVAFASFLGVIAPVISEEPLRTPDGLHSLGISSAQLVAIGVVALLTAINCFGITVGKLVQDVFTIAKVGALVALVVLGITLGRNAEAIAANSQDFWGTTPINLAFLMAAGGAMVGSLFSADAWNSVTFTAAEMQNPRRNVPLSLAIGAGMVVLLYFLANVAYLLVLPLEGTKGAGDLMSRGIQHATNNRVGTAMAEGVFGGSGAAIMAVAIMISTFGCVNGLIIVGARVYYAMSRDGLFFESAGRLNRHNVPGWGLVVQGIWSAILTLSGTYGDLLDYVIFASLLFYVLTVASIFIFRKRLPDAPRPYRAIGYPVVPAFYILAAFLIMIDLLFVKPTNTWPGLLIVLSGVPVYWVWSTRRKARLESQFL